MSLFEINAVLLSLSALFSYINARFIGLPNSIAVMAFSLIFSLLMVSLNHLGLHDLNMWASDLVEKADLGKNLLNGLLSFLLFAGALHVNLAALYDQKWIVAFLATFGVLLTTFLVGIALWWVLGLLGISLPLIYCLLFGAIVAPTDPVAVLAILNSVHAPEVLSTRIAGESLFNDGVAVVTFLAILSIALGQEEASLGGITLLFVEEVVGGVLLGLILGYIGNRLLSKLDHYQVEILITLALVAGGYALANRFHMSGPLAIVIAGLMIGNCGREQHMSDTTREHLDTFWELIDEILNAMLFLLIGLEVLLVSFDLNILLAGLIAIPLVLFSRFISVGVPVKLMKSIHVFGPNSIKALTWGGIRGGVSVALALGIPDGPERDLILALTYVVVVFSILVQGLTVKQVLLSQTDLK